MYSNTIYMFSFELQNPHPRVNWRGGREDHFRPLWETHSGTRKTTLKQCVWNVAVSVGCRLSRRFLQTWWHLSRAWERGGAPLFPSCGARTCWGRPAAHPVPGRAPRLQPSLPPELRTKSTHFREWREIPREHNGVAKQTAMNYASYLRTDLWKPLP